MSGQLGSNGSESDCNLVDSLLYDIRSGFPIKKGFEKDIKVCWHYFLGERLYLWNYIVILNLQYSTFKQNPSKFNNTVELSYYNLSCTVILGKVLCFYKSHQGPISSFVLTTPSSRVLEVDNHSCYLICQQTISLPDLYIFIFKQISGIPNTEVCASNYCWSLMNQVPFIK